MAAVMARARDGSAGARLPVSLPDSIKIAANTRDVACQSLIKARLAETARNV